MKILGNHSSYWDIVQFDHKFNIFVWLKCKILKLFEILKSFKSDIEKLCWIFPFYFLIFCRWHLKINIFDCLCSKLTIWRKNLHLNDIFRVYSFTEKNKLFNKLYVSKPHWSFSYVIQFRREIHLPMPKKKHGFQSNWTILKSKLTSISIQLFTLFNYPRNKANNSVKLKKEIIKIQYTRDSGGMWL